MQAAFLHGCQFRGSAGSHVGRGSLTMRSTYLPFWSVMLCSMRWTVPGGVAAFTASLGRENAYLQPGIATLEDSSPHEPGGASEGP